MSKNGQIAVLDFGGQYVRNLERNFKEGGFPITVYPFNTTAKELLNDDVKGIVISGGPYSVYDPDAPKLKDDILSNIQNGKKWPTLGICYGHQLIAYYMRGKVAESHNGEYGFAQVKILSKEGIFADIPKDEFTCWMSHRDEIQRMPSTFNPFATTLGKDGFAAIKHKALEWYGLQFHPEVTHTEYGDLMLKNFASICKVESEIWNVLDFINLAIENIQQEVRNSKVIAAVSGGVDSTVAAILAQKALRNDNLLCVHVDTGLMRKNESDLVLNQLEKLGLRVKVIDAKNRFLKILNGKLDSDEKRIAIGNEFIRIFEEEAEKFGASHLLQATIQPDVIESSRGQAIRLQGANHGGFIKLHHNVGGLPESMKLGLLEPLRPLYKYQIRSLANAICLPTELAERQPSPGPSAAVRIVDQVTDDKIVLWQEINEYVENMLAPYRATQYFSVLIPNNYELDEEKNTKNELIIREMLGNSLSIFSRFFKYKSIGIKGDERVYGKTLAVGICDKDGQFAFDRYDHITLLNLQSKLTGAHKDTVRIAFLLSDRTDFTKPYAVIIRAVESRDFMTATPKDIPWNVLRTMDEHVRGLSKQIGATYYDYTTKPSSTIEYI